MRRLYDQRLTHLATVVAVIWRKCLLSSIGLWRLKRRRHLPQRWQYGHKTLQQRIALLAG
jgi:hypothetical protein